MARITLDSVGKVYPDGRRAVSSVDLDVEDGEFLVLVGPSGCGKSTVLRMIAGLEDITEGKITIGERVVNDVAPKDRDIAMVFQNYALYPHMTVFDNMAFGLKLRKMPADEIRRRVDEAATLLEIEDYLTRKPKALSGGQRQRVAMGRAIVREPSAFLMDEPLSNLDAKLRVVMRAELALLHERLSTTTVYVTHDQVEAMTLGERVAVLKPLVKGSQLTLQQVATPATLFNEPANLFVAGFIGSPAMNFVNGHMESADGGVDAVFAGFKVRLSPELLKKNKELAGWMNQDLVIGIRPDDFEERGFARDAAADNTISVTAEVVEVLGSESFVHFEVASPPVVTPDIETLMSDPPEALGGTETSRFTARVSADAAIAEHDRVDLAINTTKMHFFDPKTALRIA